MAWHGMGVGVKCAGSEWACCVISYHIVSYDTTSYLYQYHVPSHQIAATLLLLPQCETIKRKKFEVSRTASHASNFRTDASESPYGQIEIIKKICQQWNHPKALHYIRITMLY